MSNSTRNAGIDLLRIIAMSMVIMLHINNADLGGVKAVNPGSINMYVAYFLESVSVVAVDVFVILSGYCSANRKTINFLSPLLIISEFYFARFGKTVIDIIVGGKSLNLNTITTTLIPNNWYIVLFISLYFLAPYINYLVKSLKPEQNRILLIICFILISIWPTAVDLVSNISGNVYPGLSSVGVQGSQNGYTLINFLFVYLIGVNLSYNLQKKTITPFAVWIVSTIILFIWSVPKGDVIAEGSAWSYSNPLVIISATALCVIFAKMKIKGNKVVSVFAKSTLMVYLLQNSFLVRIPFEFVSNKSVIIMVGAEFLSIIAVYTICTLIHYLFHISVGRIIERLGSNIPRLQQVE